VGILRLRALVPLAAVAAAGLLTVSCQRTDLSKALTVEPVLTGYYDDGLDQGWTHLVPDLTFKLKNVGTQPVARGIRVTVSFWFTAETDGENDSIVLPGLDDRLDPGRESREFTARAPHGFRLEGARQDFFAHSLFKDMTAKVFAQSGGTIYRLGEFPIQRQIIPNGSSKPGHP